MKNTLLFSIAGIVVILVFVGFIPSTTVTDTDFPSRVKVALRQVGNQLLLAQGDSTSLVLPVVQEQNNTYLVSFQKPIDLLPDTVIQSMEAVVAKAGLPKQYRVEVLHCSSGEVVYSFEIQENKEQSIVPCLGRALPNDCYILKFQFIEANLTTYKQQNYIISNKHSLLYVLLFISLVPVSVLVMQKRSKATPVEGSGTALGAFTFYPSQYMLTKGNLQLALSKKECELLVLFMESPNQTIPREELSKKVWEDHGVVVGRSLDTYISKLRKKLQADPNLQLTNVHGIGYKLEVVYG